MHHHYSVLPLRGRAASGVVVSLCALLVLAAPGQVAARRDQPSRLSEDGHQLNLTTTSVTGKDGLVSPSERAAFPLDRYEVRDDGAGYFDVAERREFIRDHGTPGMAPSRRCWRAAAKTSFRSRARIRTVSGSRSPTPSCRRVD